MRLGFASAFCAAVRTLAEIGLRRFADAGRTLDRLSRAARTIDDPWLLATVAILSLKMELSRGLVTPPYVSIVSEDGRVSPGLRGELFALQALACATADNDARALALAVQARQVTRSIEADVIAGFAELVVAANQNSRGGFPPLEAGELLTRVLAQEILDPAILTLRASRRLLKQLWQSPDTQALIAEIITRADDVHLATTVGLGLGARSERIERLTPRECEVLALLCRGLSNREMAQTLVVEESTVKVHVHHVLAKLGAKTRLQAILIAQAEGFVRE
jgi:ATP/maltotriose-dependent transcriptional regulator MalT